VAGVFAVVGVIIATIVAIVAFILCKRRRRRRIRLSISRPLPYPENPFENPRATPSPTQMRYAASDSSHRNLVGSGLGVDRGQRNLLDDEFDHVPASPTRSHPPSIRSSRRGSEIIQTFAGIGAGGNSVGRPPYNSTSAYNGPFAEYHTFQPSHQQRPSNDSSAIGLAISDDKVQERPQPTPRHIKRVSVTPSAAPSTPSIYPATLPGGDEDLVTESSHGPVTPSTTEEPASPFGVKPVSVPVRPPRKRPVAPLPPRNPLRVGDQSKLLVRTQVSPEDANILDEKKPYEPLTPPASVSSESNDSPRLALNPFADYNEYMSKIQPPADIKPRDTFYTRRKVVSPHVCTFPRSTVSLLHTNYTPDVATKTEPRMEALGVVV
jgi:hypothetical protein